MENELEMELEDIRTKTNEKIEKVFNGIYENHDLQELDEMGRNGSLLYENVQNMISLYILNAETVLMDKIMEFVVLMSNVMEEYIKLLDVDDLAKIANIWYSLQQEKGLGSTQLPMFRRKLVNDIEHLQNQMRSIGMNCEVHLDEYDED